jgi:hypothetical protein
MALSKTISSGTNAIGNVQNVMVITGMADDVTLTAQEAADVGVIDATATASKAIVFPAGIKGKVLVVTNSTSATYAVTVKVSADSSAPTDNCPSGVTTDSSLSTDHTTLSLAKPELLTSASNIILVPLPIVAVAGVIVTLVMDGVKVVNKAAFAKGDIEKVFQTCKK